VAYRPYLINKLREAQPRARELEVTTVRQALPHGRAASRNRGCSHTCDSPLPYDKLCATESYFRHSLLGAD